jgi:hypothetical protein
MLSALRRAMRPIGQLCICASSTSRISPPARLELRELRDGRQFQIVKIYRSPQTPHRAVSEQRKEHGYGLRDHR